MHRSILLVDDDEATLRLLQRFFEAKGWTVYRTGSAQEALGTFDTARPAITILDMQMPILSGIDLLEILRERDPDAVVLMLTGHADVQTAVEAMRLGAENYLVKPIDLGHLEAVVEKALEKTTLRRYHRVMADRQMSPTAEESAKSSQVATELQPQLERIAATELPVLVQGETGTGKGWVARSIHCSSNRSRAPFVDVNCASLSEENLERELFGEERLTTRGRKVDARGVFELADGGTLFLDEVGLLHRDLQPRLLRVLEAKRFRRVGGAEEVEVDVRVIAATNRDLESDVREGRFREDLYYRLGGVPIHLRPLRERPREEILGLARTLIQDMQQRTGSREPIRLLPEVEDLLIAYPWPGNIRQLRNTLERILIVHPGLRQLEPRHLPPEIVGGPDPGASNGRLDPRLPLEEVERYHIESVLRYFGGNRARAAKSLGIGRRTLYDKLERYGLGDVVPG